MITAGMMAKMHMVAIMPQLISTALKEARMPRGIVLVWGEVSIRASVANGSYTLAVRDTGPGIPAGDHSRIFEEFQQADSSVTKKKSGTGLGLAIAKRIIEMHGGRIWVESVPGQGATFSFSVPTWVQQQGGPT